MINADAAVASLRPPPLAIDGLGVRPLTPHADHRGILVELFRDEWDLGARPVQWNAVRSRAGALRGVHVHHTHDDYLTVVVGTMLLGLHDLRPDSPTHGTSGFLTLTGDAPVAVVIPTGVCHGFYFAEPAVYVYGLTRGWDLTDELGCRFDDLRLGLEWPDGSPDLSTRDREAGDYEQMRTAYLAATAP